MSANQGLDTVVFSDFSEYSAALGKPVAWVVAPLAGDNKAVGAIAVQLPVDRINDVMTGNGHWQESGLGETGEAYLAGGARHPDHALPVARSRRGPRERTRSSR